MYVLYGDSGVFCSVQPPPIFVLYMLYVQYLAVAVPIRKEVVVAIALEGVVAALGVFNVYSDVVSYILAVAVAALEDELRRY